MKKRLFTAAAAASIITAALFSGCTPKDNQAFSYKDSELPIMRSTGKPIGSTKLQAFMSDGQISLKPKSGQNLTILTLWSPDWYESSAEQIKALKQLREKYSADSLRIICIVYDTKQENAKKLIAEQSIPFEMASGDAEAYNKLEIAAVPQYWFLDSDGNVLSVYEGLMTLDDFENNIAGLIRDYKHSED